MITRLLMISAVLLAAFVMPVGAETASGYRIVALKQPFAGLEEKLKAAVLKNGMNAVNRASASDGAKSRGIAIRGDAVIGIFRNDFAVRMLEANVDAGIEAPLRVHLVEEADGTSSIRYYRPSFVFGHYDGEKIRAMGLELDAIIEQIVADTLAGP